MNKKLFTVDIKIPLKDNELLEGIRSLTTPIYQKNEKNNSFTLSSISNNKKKEKKKKNKFDNIELMAGGEIKNIADDNIERNEDTNLIDIDELLRDEDDDIGNLIINEQGKNYKKLKEKEDYKKEFAEELILLYRLLDETNVFGKELEKKYKSLDGTKVRGINKFVFDLGLLVLNSKQSKLNILKEISSVKKSIIDLKIKADGKKDAALNTMTSEHLASSYLKAVVNHGRSDFIKEMNNKDTYSGIIESINSDSDDNNIEGYNEKEFSNYNEYIASRLEKENNPFRSSDGSKYIEYENLEVKLHIKKCVDTGELEFVALDKDKQQIFDYPVPTKRDVGKMKFSPDGTYATDSRGRSYRVTEYFSSMSDE